jgi:hypothetical protein
MILIERENMMNKPIINRKNIKQLPNKPTVLFINPDRGVSAEHIVHQGISSIAAYLKEANIDCHAVLTSICNDEMIIETIGLYDYKYIGFFVTSDDTAINYIRNIVQKIKEVRADIQYLAGGPQATLAHEQLMKDIPEIDIWNGSAWMYSRRFLTGISYSASRRSSAVTSSTIESCWPISAAVPGNP